jgi:UDP:flavonoid glycosyltransferase YjiC (YdhE family)
MGRVLFAWEMGSNLGHLSRVQPLAQRLAARGHEVLVVVRDLAHAARVLGPVRIPFVQAPHATTTLKPSEPVISYADILWSQGWADASQLWGMAQAWVNLLRMFRPDVAVIDHSPTALLAARISRTACALVGTGFEIPPSLEPLPAFPGFVSATREGAIRAEQRVLENANQVLRVARAPKLQALKELFDVELRWLATFPELDHYGPRPEERYVGPVGEIQAAQSVAWPEHDGPRIFAYLRSSTPGLQTILQALAASEANVVCYAPGVPSQTLDVLRASGTVVSDAPVHLSQLLKDANLCVSYAPAGTVASSLLLGAPQLLAPSHVEAQLTAHCVECLGAGVTLHGSEDAQHTASVLRRALGSEFHGKARAFASRYAHFDQARAAEEIVDHVATLISRRKVSAQGNVHH